MRTTLIILLGYIIITDSGQFWRDLVGRVDIPGSILQGVEHVAVLIKEQYGTD